MMSFGTDVYEKVVVKHKKQGLTIYCLKNRATVKVFGFYLLFIPNNFYSQLCIALLNIMYGFIIIIKNQSDLRDC